MLVLKYVKLICVEPEKSNELQDVVGFITDIVLLTTLIPLVKITKKTYMP